MTGPRRRSVTGEALGTGLLLFIIVGSGIIAGRSSDDPALQLLFHAVAVGGGLAVLIAMFANVSGAHFNPAVTIAFRRRGSIDTGTAISYVAAQTFGAILGVAVANLVFAQPVVAVSATVRTGAGALVGELVGTLVLVLLILTLVDQGRTSWIPAGVGVWVTVMVLTTPSGGFLNPAVTLARSLTDTYTGIAPASVPGFVTVQLASGLAAVFLAWHLRTEPVPKGS